MSVFISSKIITQGHIPIGLSGKAKSVKTVKGFPRNDDNLKKFELFDEGSGKCRDYLGSIAEA